MVDNFSKKENSTPECLFVLVLLLSFSGFFNVISKKF